MTGKKNIVLFLSLIFISYLFPGGQTEEPDILSPEERQWLTDNGADLIIGRSPENFAPIEWIDEQGEDKGITEDYFRMIEKKLGFRFQNEKPVTWTNLLKDLQTGHMDLSVCIQKTPERLEYLLFTKPYISVPYIILVRKQQTENLKLEDLGNRRVGVAENYSIHEYLKTGYGHLNIVPSDSEDRVLLDLSMGRIDAGIVNLAVASYVIETLGVNNLRIAGYTDFIYKASFAVPKNLPVLHSIMEKGLASITAQERKDIYRKWITIDIRPFYKNPGFLIIVIISITVVLLSSIWNFLLRREISKRKVVESEKEKLIAELMESLKEIKTLNGLVPICSHCKSIRDDKGYWNKIEAYIEEHTDALFSHGLCPKCQKEIYGDKSWYKKQRETDEEN